MAHGFFIVKNAFGRCNTQNSCDVDLSVGNMVVQRIFNNFSHRLVDRIAINFFY